TRLERDPAADEGALPATVTVRWELASDEAMRHVVASGVSDAVGENAHSVHVEVSGLAPGQWYWYRFRALGHRSRLGRTRTLPQAGSTVSRLRLCIASCQHYEHGFYAAYRHLLADHPDLVVHLGDYIYEGAWGQNMVRPLRLTEAQTLTDYRARHALYKRDPDLQNAHAMLPWVVVWDDHEVSNDYAGASAQRIVPPDVFLKRRAGAYRAYYEHMPLPRWMAPSGPDMRIHTSLQVGSLATIFLLDNRQYRTPQACPPPGRGGATSVEPALCEALQDPTRTLLGREQEKWLDRQFSRSATPWNLLAQQTMIAPLIQPGREGSPPRVRTDGWDGYPLSRRRLLDSMRGNGLRNPVVLGGDLHAFYVADLRAGPAGSDVVASEFVGTSITSQAADQRYFNALKAANPHVHHADGTQRGYLRMTLSANRLQADLMGVADVSRVDSGISVQAGFVVEAGRPGPVKA
ncbi:MAG TPA: alkaline phosphatase D family protein, partial [Lautropia sp.]|nr:alkaline phosphatase D family protein [Lautropia sp.]